MIEIRNCYTNVIIHASDKPAMREAVGDAVALGICLTDADLTDVDLTGANLTGGDLTGVDLTGANLTHVDLTGANLTDANLTDARLTGANLTGANLTHVYLNGANLTDANLTDARLTGADLTGANLTHADLSRTDLTGVDLTRADLTDADFTGVTLTAARDDFRAVLNAAPHEVSGLLLAVREGRIDGSAYEGSCACLKGTIANIRGCNYQALGDAEALQPNSWSPSESLFMAISPGHVPAINPVAKIVEGWILEWQAEHATRPEIA